MRPRRLPQVHREELSQDEVVLVHGVTERALVLNAMAGAIWDLCDGTRTVEEIAAFICQHLPDAPTQQTTAQVQGLVGELLAAGLVEDAG